VQGTGNRSARFVTHGRGRSPSCPPKIASLPYESASLERPARRSGPTSLACQQIALERETTHNFRTARTTRSNLPGGYEADPGGSTMAAFAAA
jgi:hypothetical protein